MKKLILWFKGASSRLREFSLVALGITTKILNALESREALVIVSLIPGDLDNQARNSIILLLECIKPILETISDRRVRKDILGGLGGRIVAILDENKYPISYYKISFEETRRDNAK